MKTTFGKKVAPSKTIKIGSNEVVEPIISTPENVGQLPVDIIENNEEIRILAPLAGVEIDETQVIISGDVLTIKGTREVDPELQKMKRATSYAQECHWGPFSRSIILPMHADSGEIEATQKNHILQIRIPKKPSIQMRIVKIKSKS